MSFRALGKEVLSDLSSNEDVQNDLNSDLNSTNETICKTEFQKIIWYLRSAVKIDNIFEDEFIEDNTDNILNFLTDTNYRIVTFFNRKAQRHNLYCTMNSLPRVRFKTLIYLLKRATFEVILSYDSFLNGVIFGFLTDHIEDCPLKLINDILLTMLLEFESDYPLVMKNNFFNNVQNFLAKLTDLHFKVSGLNVLYIPRNLNYLLDQRYLVHGFEEIVSFWNEQIRNCLNDSEQKSDQDSLNFNDACDFWIYRYENLCSLQHQITKDNNLLKIIEKLRSSESSIEENFNKLTHDLELQLEISKKNIKHLRIFNELNQQFWRASNLDELLIAIRKYPIYLRMIWLKSDYFSNKTRITSMFRIVANQLISKCCHDFLKNFDLFFSSVSSISLKISNLQNCIHCFQEYFSVYTKMEHFCKHDELHPWDLDKTIVFDRILSFSRRLEDLIEICDAQMFLRLTWDEHIISKFLVFSSNYKQFEIDYENCIQMFELSLVDIQSICEQLLEISTEEWHLVMRTLHAEVHKIEIKLEELMDNIFLKVNNIEDAIELLITLIHLSNRPRLVSNFAQKVNSVLFMYKSSIQFSKNFLLNFSNQYIPILPLISGQVLIQKLACKRLCFLKKELMFCPIEWTKSQKIDIQENFLNLEKSINSIAEVKFKKWLESLGDCSRLTFNTSLLRFNLTNTMLDCNIDKTILNIAIEAKYWSLLKVQIPYYLGNIYKKFHEVVKPNFDNIILLILEYNSLKNMLSKNELILFSEFQAILDKNLRIGCIKLNWLSDKCDDFVKQCISLIYEFRELIIEFKISNREIGKVLETIEDTNLFTLKPEDIDNFYVMSQNIELNCQKIQKLSSDICDYVNLTHERLKVFLNNSLILNEWSSYLLELEKILETIIKESVERSLWKIYELNSNSNIGFINSKEIEEIFNCICENFKRIPRIFDAIGLNSSKFKLNEFYEILQNNNDILIVLKKLNLTV